MARTKRPQSPLLTWLRVKYEGQAKQARVEARAENYDKAARCQARAEAYAWTILHVETEMRRIDAPPLVSLDQARAMVRRAKREARSGTGRQSRPSQTR